MIKHWDGEWSNSIKDYALYLQEHNPLYMGTLMSLSLKFHKYVEQQEIRKIRNMLIAIRLAYPGVKFSRLFESETIEEIEKTLSPYYAINNVENPWKMFCKIAEPPR